MAIGLRTSAPSPSTRGGLATSPALRRTVLGLARAFFVSMPTVSAAPISLFKDHSHDDDHAEGPSLVILAVASIVLVLLGGAFAGLTIALMGQDDIYLQVLSDDKSDHRSKYARQVYRLLGRGKHWVLVTLLLGNVIVNETLPVVLDRFLGGGIAAVFGSTVLIVIFGEILPQSICVRYGLQIGGFMSKPVLIFMWLMAPIAWPTAKLLDWALGEDHGTVYKKSGLKTLVTLHKSLGEASDRLNEDEVTIISAVLDLKEKPVESVMTPMDDVFIMSEDQVLDEKTMNQILREGYSRIPIHARGNPNNFVGMLLVKMLITYDPEDCMKVSDFPLATLPETRPETSCLDIVNFFQEGKSHMVLVSEYPGEDRGALGVVTLEDVIEELIGEEIIDESDVYIDVHKAIRRLAPAPRARVKRNSTSGSDFKHQEEDDSKDGPNLPQGSYTAQSDFGGLSKSPKTATFMMRRGSAGNDGRPSKPVAVKANLDEMKQQLRHLGPSNPATNPKNTKSTTVKIKTLAQPGASSTTTTIPIQQPSTAADEIILEEQPEGVVDDENAPLIRPRMLGTASAERMRRSYGTSGSTDVSSKFVMPTVKAGADLGYPAEKEDDKGKRKISEAAAEAADTGDGATDAPPPDIVVKTTRSTPPHRQELGEAISPTGSQGSLSSLRSGSASTSRRRTAARSGSITENIVEMGGVRKMVLQTQSSDSDEGMRVRVESRGPSPIAVMKLSLPEREQGEDDGDGEEDLLSPGTDGPSQEDGNGQAGGGQGPKKKNRRKKRRGNR